MKRTIYYAIWCTSKENQDGIFHYSNGSISESRARVIGVYKREQLGNDGHVSIEKHHEIFEDNEWRLDHEGGGTTHIAYI